MKAATVDLAVTVGLTLPEIKEGEHYSGVILKEDGTVDYHQIGLPGELEAATWQEAMDWAASIGGDLPNLWELNLERANAAQHYECDWYWSNEQHASDPEYAWFQDFTFGNQSSNHKSARLRARAVRRVPA